MRSQDEMSWNGRLNRRTFLKCAGATALASTVGAGSAIAADTTSFAQEPADSRYDFDEVFSRIGTACPKTSVR